jgi:hypothetical protein
MSLSPKTKNMIAGSAVGGGGAIGLAAPVANIVMYHLHVEALPPEVVADYKTVVAAVVAVALTVLGGLIARISTARF